MSEKNHQITDPIELKTIDFLKKYNIKYIHDSNKEMNKYQGARKRRLDFYLPELDCFIEVKAYPSDRLQYQLEEYKDSKVYVYIESENIPLEKILQDLIK